MIELKGKFNTAIVLTDLVEAEAIAQIIAFCNHPAFEGCRLVIMPDVHSGKGSVIGFTSTIKDAVIPNIVGVDIGCFTGDTKIPILNGTSVPIEELVGRDFHVFACESGAVIPVKATARKTRSFAKLVSVKLDNGEIIRCTPDHEFMLRDGTYREASKLAKGDSLMPFYKVQDRDGYVLVRNNRTNKLSRCHWMVARSGLIGPVLQFEHERTIIHHEDMNPVNNEPNNLKFMGHSSHNIMHKIAPGANWHFGSDLFEKSRREGIKRYRQRCLVDRPERLRKRVIAIKNLPPSGSNTARIKDNGKRGRRYIAGFNKSPAMLAKARAPFAFPCLVCGRRMKSSSLDNYHYRRKHTVAEKEALNNHKVMSVTKLKEKEDVYCLNVPKYHNFALSAGVFVHNCGVLSVLLDVDKINLTALDTFVRNEIPMGHEVCSKKRFSDKALETSIIETSTFTAQETDRPLKSVGSLGGGNHFIEIGTMPDGKYRLVIHTGSRNFGLKVAQYHQGIAKRYTQETTGTNLKFKDLEYMPLDKGGRDYLRDMAVAQRMASANRRVIATDIMKFLGLQFDEDLVIESVHNYIYFDDPKASLRGTVPSVIRKGAISAFQDQPLLIPINCSFGTVYARGKGIEHHNFSAPHGAGRQMSRSKAKKSLDIEEYRKSMDGIETSSVNSSTLDEAPAAYKDPKQVLEDLKWMVDIDYISKPVWNIKSCKPEEA